METVNLDIKIRTATSSGENRRLRIDGFLPGVVYGKDIDSTAVYIKMSDFRAAVSKHGRNAVYNVKLSESQDYPVIIKHVQFDPVRDDLVHVDLQKISLTEKIRVDIPVRIIGREAVEAERMLIIQQLDYINVSCLPGQGPQAFEIDASQLGAGDSFTVGDIPAQEGIDIETDLSQVVFSVNEAREEEVEEEVDEEVELELEDEDQVEEEEED